MAVVYRLAVGRQAAERNPAGVTVSSCTVYRGIDTVLPPDTSVRHTIPAPTVLPVGRTSLFGEIAERLLTVTLGTPLPLQ